MRETAGKLENGFPIAAVDAEHQEIDLIVPPGWTVTMLASNSGCHLKLDDRTSQPTLRKFTCEQVGPVPELIPEPSDPSQGRD